MGGYSGIWGFRDVAHGAVAAFNVPFQKTGENLKSSPKSQSSTVGVRIRGTLEDIDPLNKVPFKRARSRVKKRPLLRGLPNTTLGPKPTSWFAKTKGSGARGLDDIGRSAAWSGSAACCQDNRTNDDATKHVDNNNNDIIIIII